VSRKTRQPPRARAAVAHLPRRRPRAGLARYLPSSRSLVTGLALAALAALLYVVARESSLFAVRTIRVEGASPKLARRVERALQPVEGESLLKVSGGEVTRLATALPQVADVGYDRAFPNTLTVRVVPEVPVAVLRRGAESWLVSRRGRVIARVARGAAAALPRIWIPRTTDVALGATLAAGGGAEQVAALVPAQAAGLQRIVSVGIDRRGQVTYVLRGGVQLRAGGSENLPLKLAIARRILATTQVAGYLDVSVPERPVALTNPQVSTGG
jgi:cell division septal protein FtsQ